MGIKYYVNGVQKSVVTKGIKTFLTYPCENDKINCYSYETVLPSGIYLFELWGASGGNSGDINPTSRGGFSSGILKIKSATKAFFRTGASGIYVTGASAATSAVFNGGGSGKNGWATHPGPSGGGATDIRIGVDDVYHRLIVAGGGGGASGYLAYPPGHGGGEKGVTITTNNAGSGGKGGEQTGESSFFGFGGNATNGDGCGGGGGWYGGVNGGTDGNSNVRSGGGGSGFVFNKINQESATKAGLLLEAKYYLKNAYMISGSDHEYEGDGKIIITTMINECKTYHIRTRPSNVFVFLVTFCVTK